MQRSMRKERKDLLQISRWRYPAEVKNGSNAAEHAEKLSNVCDICINIVNNK